MNKENLVRYKIEVEINAIKIEEILNLCTRNGIPLSNVRKINKVLISFETFYEYYKDIQKIVKRCGGKIRITREMGNIIKIKRIKKSLSFFVSGIGFLVIIFILSSFVWAIDIETEKNLSPFEIREILNQLGIKQGMQKNKINVYEIEKEIENRCDEVLWIRTRIEGSTLKISLKEKVNPPERLNVEEGNVYAKMDGEIKRIYAENGTAVAKPGDIVRKGDLLIEGINGTGDTAFETKADGSVLANTFYTKEVEVLVSGKESVRTGKKDNDIYLDMWGKKIYLKKSSNSFQNYDKIESNDGLIKEVTYYEKEERKINVNKEEKIKSSLESLKKLLQKELPIDAKIIDTEDEVLELGDGKIKIIGQFTVEQNIAHR